MVQEEISFIRYPGGKKRILKYIAPHLLSRGSINGRFVEPFLGGGAVFFAVDPKRALLSDINDELIDLYRGIRRFPLIVWKLFKNFPTTKKGYYKIRGDNGCGKDLAFRAARTLYLNRTCFKGMWRHNLNGEFNVGYGGQDRRWVINQEMLPWVAKKLRRASLKCSDFEPVIDNCNKNDFIFIDPPYRPGEREMVHDHYRYGKFSFDDHKRLAKTLNRATRKGIRWAMTTSAHPDIVNLFRKYNVMSIPKGTGKKIGVLTNSSGEALIRNYWEVSQ